MLTRAQFEASALFDLHRLPECAGGSADLRFWRRADGHSEYEVLSTEGPVHVVRQPSPWSMTATLPERARDLFVSLLPGK